MMVDDNESNRRPLNSRGSVWSRMILSLLLKTPITANQLSCLSMVFALVVGVALWRAGSGASPVALVLAAVGIQGRLLCNLMDGMVAVEGQRAGRYGELYNEIPDRVSDIVILLGAGFGYASHEVLWVSSVTLGWMAALLAVLTAYVRQCGAAIGAGQVFLGPMAKPHRMALLTGACVVEMAGIMVGWWFPVIPTALLVMNVGCVITLGRRVRKITEILKGEVC